jgi:hypothetical protein
VRWYDRISGEPTAIVGETVNLSAEGMAVRVGRAPTDGAWIEALLPHVHGEPRFVCGRVMHTRQVLTGTYEIGIRFSGEYDPG